MSHNHLYRVTVAWQGNLGDGTRRYAGYSRNHEVVAAGKPPIPGSSDPAFRGDPVRWNPEELLVASVSTCHQLWYLHLASTAGVSVVDYVDDAEGTMVEEASGAGRFVEIVLHPRVTIAAGGDVASAERAHDQAHEMCFVANSVNFPVRCQPVIVVAT